MTKRAHPRLCLVGACEKSTWIFTKFLLQVHNYLIQINLKLCKDPNFGCEDILKLLLMFFIIDFLCIFHVSPITHLRSLESWMSK